MLPGIPLTVTVLPEAYPEPGWDITAVNTTPPDTVIFAVAPLPEPVDVQRGIS